MANLPPKPESPVKEERRHDPRDGVTTARPMVPAPPRSPHPPPPPPSHYRNDHLSDSERTYVPRSRIETDSYVASYNSRRPPLREWERDRGPPRDFDWRRDSRRDWRDDRRDTRPYDRRRDDDRFRRRYDLGLPVGQGPHPAARVHLLVVRVHHPDDGFLQAEGQGHEPGHLVEEVIHPSVLVQETFLEAEAEVHLLGRHHLNDLSSATTLYQTAHELPEPALDLVVVHARAHEKKLPSGSPKITSRPLSPKRTEIAPPPKLTSATSPPDLEPVVLAPKIPEISATKTETFKPSVPPIPSPGDHPMQATPDHPIAPEMREDTMMKVDIVKDKPPIPQPRNESIIRQSSSTPKPDTRSEPRGRSHSPPKGPRAQQWRKTSKSPPKGPRNHGGSATPSMIATPVPPPAPVPASVPQYPTGPRAERRPPLQQKEEVRSLLQSTEYTRIPPPTNERWARSAEQPGPKGRYGVTQMELELVRYRATRVSLNKEHDQVSRDTRRALHELDMATIDLRMAETRKKVADAQLEKAKQGLLGIEGAPTDSTSD
ncbi:hypothetical protein AN958_04192 [Leucoagaricus sp. SymC.cos]|nr:hypothetical protein AN958_04192 [Leucoagaricus sp. SymC.cos]